MSDLEQEVSGLEKKVEKARDDYYNKGESDLTDAEYDAIYDRLKSLKENSPAVTAVGAPVPEVSAWPKVKHLIPMGSLSKVQTPEEFQTWIRHFRKDIQFLVTDKLDGISVSVDYVDGQYRRACTRGGEDEIGEDITPNVARMIGVLPVISVQGTVTLRGEIVLHRASLAAHFPDKTSTRNTAAGTAKRLDGVGCEHLHVYFYQTHGPSLESEVAQFTWLERMGFLCPRWASVDSSRVEEIWENYQAKVRDSLPYDIDGLVIRIDDLAYQESLGDTNGRPKGAVAFKFRPLLRETRATGIVYQVGGTGRVTPVAVVDPVVLLGAEVRRASLYNQAYIRQIGFHVGATVLLTRANDVIPRIVSVTERVGDPEPAPTLCPECGYGLEEDGEYLVCLNTAECPAQVEGRLKRWVSELNILEWGDVLIEKIVKGGLATDVPGLYRLSEGQLAALDRMGPSSAKKAREQLWGAVPVLLERLVGAMGVPLCATSTMELIVQAGYDNLEKLKTVTIDQLQAIPGMGPKRASALRGWLTRNGQLLDRLLDSGIQIKERSVGTLTGKSFCFTGKMVQKRPLLENMVKDAGGQVKQSVGKGLTYLVIADPDSTSTKAVAARKNGTICISEEAFVQMVSGSPL